MPSVLLVQNKHAITEGAYRQRRCTACLHVTSSMEQMTSAAVAGQLGDSSSASPGSCPADSLQTQGAPELRQLLCLLEVWLHSAAQAFCTPKPSVQTGRPGRAYRQAVWMLQTEIYTLV